MTLLHISQQAETTAQRQAERAQAFVAPQEVAAPTVEEKRKKRKHKNAEDADVDDTSSKSKKKKRKSDELEVNE
jgi:ribosomal RNA assembly protein